MEDHPHTHPVPIPMGLPMGIRIPTAALPFMHWLYWPHCPASLRYWATNCIANESVPIQLAQCRFSALAIPNAKTLIHFSNKNSTEAILSNSSRICYGLKYDQNAGCSLRKKCCVIYCNFRPTFVPYWLYVPDRVLFKLAVTVHQCLNGRAPPYLSWSTASRSSHDSTLWVKKTRHITLAHNFTKYWPIFKILSLLDSAGNL